MRRPFSPNPVSFLLGILFAFCAFTEMLAAQQTSTNTTMQVVHPEVPRIPAIQVKELLAKKGDIVVVDVNPADYFKLWHIPGAVNIPLTMDDHEKRERKLKKLPTGKLIVLYCLCEEGADSSEIALELRRLGYPRDKVKVLEGASPNGTPRDIPCLNKRYPIRVGEGFCHENSGYLP
jgi:rhodanese-related sulfurtransferase